MVDEGLSLVAFRRIAGRGRAGTLDDGWEGSVKKMKRGAAIFVKKMAAP